MAEWGFPKDLERMGRFGLHVVGAAQLEEGADRGQDHSKECKGRGSIATSDERIGAVGDVGVVEGDVEGGGRMGVVVVVVEVI